MLSSRQSQSKRRPELDLYKSKYPPNAEIDALKAWWVSHATLPYLDSDIEIKTEDLKNKCLFEQYHLLIVRRKN